MQKLRNHLGGNEKIIAFLASQAVTLFGSSLVQYALTWYITLQSNDGVMVAISVVIMFLPQILVSPFAGVWADRYNRKLLTMLSDGGIAIATIVLMLILRGGIKSYAPVFIIMALRAIGGSVQSPAVSALIPQLVPEEKLMRVNSINGTIQSCVMLLSPAVGGAVLAIGDITTVLMIDVCTAAIGIGVLMLIKIPTHERKAPEAGETSGMLSEMLTGLRYMKGSFFLRRMMMYYLLASVLIAPASFFNVLFVTRVYSGDYLYLTLNEMAFFLGSIAGGIALATWGGFRNRLHTLVLGCFVFGATTALMGLVPPFWMYLVIMILCGLTVPTFNSPVMVLLQEKVPQDMMGRVFSLMGIASSIVFMLASGVFGPLMNVVPIQYVMLVSGLLLLGVAGLFLIDKRYMLEGLPKEAPTDPGTEPEATIG